MMMIFQYIKSHLLISFVLLFILLTIFILLVAMVIGLNIANKLVGPIGSLIGAAEEVGSGNLNYKITNQVLDNININELKRHHSFIILPDAPSKLICFERFLKIDTRLKRHRS